LHFSLVILAFAAVDLLSAGLVPELGGLPAVGVFLLLLGSSFVGALAFAAITEPDPRGLPQRSLPGWIVGGAVTTATWAMLTAPLVGVTDRPIRDLALITIAGGALGWCYGMLANVIFD
jgi:hypothetical protein